MSLKIHPVVSSPDYWAWKYNKSGDYSVKSGYWLASQSINNKILRDIKMLPSINPLKDIVCNLKTSPKIKSFLWKVLSGAAIPVADKIVERGMSVDSRCQRCGNEGECANHVLFTCSVAIQIWAQSNFPSPPNGFDRASVYENLYYVFSLSKNARIPPEITRAFPWIFWMFWKNWNKLIFEGVSYCGLDSIEKIIEDSNKWFLAQSVERSIQGVNYCGLDFWTHHTFTFH